MDLNYESLYGPLDSFAGLLHQIRVGKPDHQHHHHHHHHWPAMRVFGATEPPRSGPTPATLQRLHSLRLMWSDPGSNRCAFERPSLPAARHIHRRYLALLLVLRFDKIRLGHCAPFRQLRNRWWNHLAGKRLNLRSRTTSCDVDTAMSR